MIVVCLVCPGRRRDAPARDFLYRAHEYGGKGDAPITYEYCRSIEPGDKRRKQLNDVRNRAWGNLEVDYDPNHLGSAMKFPREQNPGY